MQVRRSRATWLAVLASGLAACANGGDVDPPHGGDDGAGGFQGTATPDPTGTPSFGDPPAQDGGQKPTSEGLTATLRDFRVYDPGDTTTNPDFENVPRTDQNGNPNDGYRGPWNDLGIVSGTLGADGKPVYASPTGKTLTTHGRAAFDMWFRDVPGTNVRVDYPILLAQNGNGSYGFDSDKTGTPLSAQDPRRMFFPLDDGSKYATPFGNQGRPHNYAFTMELHTTFTYRGGEYFKFRGDDDIFVFIDRRRVIDLGGIHGPLTADVEVDTLGLTKGKDYALDFFSAERHVDGSNILFTTTLDLRPAPR